MAYTQADLDALDAAIASGVLRVTKPDGSEVTYRSLAAMREVRKLIRDEVSASTRTNQTRVTTSKGLT